MKKGRAFLIAILFFCSLQASSALATSIAYQTTDLGSNTWRYDYFVSDYYFPADYGFTIFFEYGLFEDITELTNPANWDVYAYDPELVFGSPDDGAYDALAMVPGASLGESFSVQFTWLGSGSPGSQFFEIYYDGPGADDFEILETGQTFPIPEPATLILLMIGVSGILLRKRA